MSTTSLSPAVNTQPLLIELLLRRGLLTESQHGAIRDAQAKEKLSLEETLIRKGFSREHDIAAAYSEHFLLPLYTPDPNADPVDKQFSHLLPEKLCRDHLIAPVRIRDKTLYLAFFTPHALHIIDEIQLLTGLSVCPMIAALSTIEDILRLIYEDSVWSGGGQSDTADFEAVDDGDDSHIDADHNGDDLVHLDQPPPPGRDGRIIRYVNQMLEQAIHTGASDIHIEPFEDCCRVRLRIDGNLTNVAPPPQSLFTAIVSRIKVLAKMDIAEKRVPQDGAIALKRDDKRIDVRANTVPTVYGEKVVLRILNRSAIPIQLCDLGLDSRQSNDLSESIQMPHGLMLVTGPTGSGKSTTLYACLNRLNDPHRNICTAEDPVEYKFTGINQIQMKPQVGLTFASALRSFLRQDPDIIMVGEVRDSETAQICMRAALTGHFVLSTLHTNDALAAVDRLQDMGIEPFVLASTLRVLVAQRLIRRLCPNCREPYTIEAETAHRYKLTSTEAIFRPRGCKECRDSGYRGRIGVFEVIRVTGRLADLIQNRTPLAELRRAAANEGMKLLRDSAIEAVRQGTTSLEEALSITISEDG